MDQQKYETIHDKIRQQISNPKTTTTKYTIWLHMFFLIYFTSHITLVPLVDHCDVTISWTRPAAVDDFRFRVLVAAAPELKKERWRRPSWTERPSRRYVRSSSTSPPKTPRR